MAWLAWAPGTVCAAPEENKAMPGKMIGMYVHQHWSYSHPYAARTWTLEDWRGYADGLKRLGYNTVMIWPMLETMPDPLTPSDTAHLDKMTRIIDMLHSEFGMWVYITLTPNVVAKDAEAAKYTFEDRPFFYCDDRVNPADTAACAAMMKWREQLLRPLAAMDGLTIIDSDPGGYPNSTNAEFVRLLADHQTLLNRLRSGIEVVYWIHAGWRAYGRFYATGVFEWGKDGEIEDTVRGLVDRLAEPWGITGARLSVVEQAGQGARMFPFPYGLIEGEPSFPMTNYNLDLAERIKKEIGPRGIMGNAQSHCLQLPNTFAFARGAQGHPVSEADYGSFAEDLIPGGGKRIADAWKALAGTDAAAMRAATDALSALKKGTLVAGPLRGLLFGDPDRFINDLILQLQQRAAFETFCAAAFATPVDQPVLAETLGQFAMSSDAWQRVHGYKNMWVWPRMEEALRKVGDKGLDAVLVARDYQGEGTTPFDKLKDGFLRVETYTPRLIAAMKTAVESRNATLKPIP